MEPTEQTEDQKKIIEKEKWETDELNRISKKYNQAKVIMLKVPLNDEYTDFSYGWIRYPQRADVSIAMTMTDTDPLKGKEIVLRNSWLEGDDRILNDDELFLSACTVLDTVIGVRQALIKKNWTSGL